MLPGSIPSYVEAFVGQLRLDVGGRLSELSSATEMAELRGGDVLLKWHTLAGVYAGKVHEKDDSKICSEDIW